MALERQSIEKKDFPIGRRGYDPDAVDAHLARIAEEVDHLKTASRRRTETLASAASEQVRAIVEAAESSAAEIQRQAEDEAREIRAEAAEEAQSARQQANQQAREYVGKVSESTSVMLQRLDAMESELGALIESLRTGANRLGADLHLLEGSLDEVRGAVAPRPPFESEPEPPSHAAPAPAGRPLSAPAPAEAAPAVPAVPAVPAAPAAPAAGTAAIPPATPGEADEFEDELAEADDADDEAGLSSAIPEDESEGARLIALNMALNGTPREETNRYLEENFELRNRAQLLDEVYSSLES